jgi:HprK-related kinase A
LRVADPGGEALGARLEGRGLGLDLGAASIRIRSDVPDLPGLLQTLYGSYRVEESRELFDVTVKLRRVRGVRRLIRPQVELLVDGAVEFEPFPLDTPMPLLEWGMNYALASRLCCYLLLHSGAVESRGRAVLLPAMPGSGKSTLTAALALRGFRLLSDEFGVVRLSDSQLLPMLRPIALKNESIDLIARFAPQAVIGPRYDKTHKGTVAHLAPQLAHVDACHESAAPALIIFPRHDPSVALEMEPVPRARAFARLAVNSFNYEILGPVGFDALGKVVQSSTCYQLRYRELDRAVEAITELLDRAILH